MKRIIFIFCALLCFNSCQSVIYDNMILNDNSIEKKYEYFNASELLDQIHQIEEDYYVLQDKLNQLQDELKQIREKEISKNN